MFTISKRFSFSASHELLTLGPDHPCARLHGHNYDVEVVSAAAALDDDGFVHDYRELDVLKRFLDSLQAGEPDAADEAETGEAGEAPEAD